MRMWMVDPELLCDRHLLGEHGELHKHWPSFVKKNSIAGRVRPVAQIEPKSMNRRHDELAMEMKRRGMNHNSPFDRDLESGLAYLPARDRNAKVDPLRGLRDLCERCEDCRKRIQGAL